MVYDIWFMIYDLHDIVEEISEKNDEKSDGAEEYAY